VRNDFQFFVNFLNGEQAQVIAKVILALLAQCRLWKNLQRKAFFGLPVRGSWLQPGDVL
jgi:hypothetical protein